MRLGDLPRRGSVASGPRDDVLDGGDGVVERRVRQQTVADGQRLAEAHFDAPKVIAALLGELEG